MLAIFGTRFLVYQQTLTDNSPAFLIAYVWLMFWGLLLLYSQNLIMGPGKKDTLSTTGPSRIVRHPIYHAFFFIDATHFFYTNLANIMFWLSWVLFVALMVVLCITEERFVLAKFGGSARSYYARTPRFLFEWLWFRARKQ